MIDFTGVKTITIPEGVVKKIENASGVLWEAVAKEIIAESVASSYEISTRNTNAKDRPNALKVYLATPMTEEITYVSVTATTVGSTTAYSVREGYFEKQVDGSWYYYFKTSGSSKGTTDSVIIEQDTDGKFISFDFGAMPNAQFRTANVYEWHFYHKKPEADETPPVIDVIYSTTSWTNQDIVVTLIPNEEVVTPNGWTKQTDGKLTKSYSTNTTETIEVSDLSGNKTSVSISITKIDKTKPRITIKSSSVQNDSGAYTKLDLQFYDANSQVSYFMIDNTRYNRSGQYVDVNDGAVFKWTTGEHTIVVYDNAGNSTSKIVLVDKG